MSGLSSLSGKPEDTTGDLSVPRGRDDWGFGPGRRDFGGGKSRKKFTLDILRLASQQKKKVTKLRKITIFSEKGRKFCVRPRAPDTIDTPLLGVKA